MRRAFNKILCISVLFIAEVISGLHGLFNVSQYEMLVMLGITALGMYGNLSYTFAVK